MRGTLEAGPEMTGRQWKWKRSSFGLHLKGEFAFRNGDRDG